MNISAKNRRGMIQRRVIIIVTLCSLLGLLLWQSQQQLTKATESEPTPPFIVEYPLPANIPDAQPRHIIVEAPGRLWFTLPGANALGSLVVTTTVDFMFTVYDDLPTANSEPHDLVLDTTNQVIWFTQLAASKIGRFDLNTKQFDEFSLPANSSPTGIDLDTNNMVWVALRDSNRVARLNPATGIINEFTYGTSGAQFADLGVSGTNIVWLTAPGLNRLVSYNPATNTFTNVPVTDIGLDPFPPQAIAMQANRPWISAPSQGWLGRYSPGTFALFLWYRTPESDSGPTGIDYRSLGGTSEVWYVQPSANLIGRILVDDQDRLVTSIIAGLPTANGQPYDIVADSNGHAWITAPGTNVIAEWRPPYVVYSYLPLIQRP